MPKTEAMRAFGERRWAGVGGSSDLDSRRAALAAATAALAGDDPRLLLVFGSARYDPEAVLAGVGEVAGGVPLIGCSSTRVVGGHDLVVVALGGPGLSAVTAAAPHAAADRRAAGSAVAACAVDPGDRPHHVLIMLTDGVTPGQEEILAGAYAMVGASVPMVGGAASPDAYAGRTFQLHGDQVLTDGVVGALLSSDGPLGIGLRHGWRKVGEPMIVTKSSGGDVHTLDDRPALTAYLDRLGAPAAAYEDPAAFETFAQVRPIGIRRRSGEEVRGVSSPGMFGSGGLRSSGEVPEGGLVWPMEGDERSVLDSAADACRDAVAALEGVPPLALLTFDCESRGRLLGDEGVRAELARMTGEVPGVPVGGPYTWGEICRTRGINGFHNQTLVVLAVG